MNGHIERRKYVDKKTGKTRTTSTWSVWYTVPRSPGEPRQQKFKSGFASKKAASDWLAQKMAELRRGISPDADRITVDAYLSQWLESLEGPGSKVRASALRASRLSQQR
jgi:hypothetical protein